MEVQHLINTTPTHPHHIHTHSPTHSSKYTCTHTALSDTQFIAPSGGSIDFTATFPAGASSLDISFEFPINDDVVALEAVEELIATLSLNNAPNGVELGTPSETVIRIQDDDGECD